MKRLLTFVLLTVLTLTLAACGASHRTDLAIGQALVKKGDCAAAAPYLDSTIQNPGLIADLGLAYYLKGRCAEEAGNVADAYENFYATKVVACYSVSHDPEINLNTYGRAEFCEEILPKKLKSLVPSVGEETAQALRAKIDKKLEDRYLERFYKKP